MLQWGHGTNAHVSLLRRWGKIELRLKTVLLPWSVGTRVLAEYRLDLDSITEKNSPARVK